MFCITGWFNMGCCFKQEDFCALEYYTGRKYQCEFAEGEIKLCVATSKDLIEVCPDCYQLSDKCVCGTLGW